MRKALFRQAALTASVLAVTTLSPTAFAQTNYTDSTGDILSTSSIMDITSVEVSNNAFDLIFKITLAGDPVATDWGKYMIAFDTKVGGDTVGNGWGRPIAMSQGMDYWVGSWVDGGNGAELRDYTTSWSIISAPGVSKTTNSLTLSVPFLNMGLGVGDTFEFDVYSSGGGGGDGAIDALANPNQTVAGWSDFYDSSTNTVNPPKTYTIQTSPDPTNRVTFLVDMQYPIALYDANPIGSDGFNTNSDVVYVRGNFNGWGATPNYALIQVGPTLFSNTVDVIAAAGSTISYKFFGSTFPGEEQPLLLCNGVRTLVITSTQLTAPLAYWSDRSLSDPTNAVTFAVDMRLPLAAGSFTSVDNVYARGSFNGWGDPNPLLTALLLTNNPSAADSNVYRGVASIQAPVGACGYAFKFWTDSPTMSNSGYETRGNRGFSINSTNEVLPLVYWDDLTPCNVLDQNTAVTFSVDMTGAVGTDTTVYDGSGTQLVYINGSFVGWDSQGVADPDWGTSPLPELVLTKNPTSNVHSVTLTNRFPAGSSFQVTYKYSLGGPDNESGFAQNHVRYVRTTAGVTNYAMPLDVWINTNPGVPREESAIGGLAAKPSTPGNVSLEWTGLPCTYMQASTNVSGPYNNLFEARGVASTNLPTSGDQMYFRLTR